MFYGSQRQCFLRKISLFAFSRFAIPPLWDQTQTDQVVYEH